MPKTNDATGATYAGYEGVVEHAGGRGSTRPGGLSQLDPNREVDGTVKEGFESDEREIEDREGATAADFGEVHSSDPERRSDDENAERRGSDAGRQERERAEEGEQSSRGASSSPSSKSGESNTEKKSSASRSSARTTANRS